MTTQAAIQPLPSLKSSADHPDRLYTAMGVLLLAIVALAFTDRYFARAWTDAPALPAFVHLHALLFVTWIVVYTAQAALAQQGLIRYHRRIGMGALALAAVIVFVGMYSALEGARRGHNPGGMPNAFAFMIVGVGDIALFGILVFAAWRFRRQRHLHKRLMLFATLGGFLWPTVVRVPFLPVGPGRFPLIMALFGAVLIAPAVVDWLRQRRIHPLDVVCALTVFASVPLRGAIGMTDTWQQFAAWLVG